MIPSTNSESENMSNADKYKKYELSFEVAGILGGLTLTVLILLIQMPNTDISTKNFVDLVNKINYINYSGSITEKSITEESIPIYKELSTGAMGLASSLFIIAVIGLKIINIEREKIPEKSLFTKFTFNGIYEASLLILLGLFPILVFPFSLLGSTIIIIVEIVWGIIWTYTWLKYKRKSTTK